MIKLYQLFVGKSTAYCHLYAIYNLHEFPLSHKQSIIIIASNECLIIHYVYIDYHRKYLNKYNNCVLTIQIQLSLSNNYYNYNLSESKLNYIFCLDSLPLRLSFQVKWQVNMTAESIFPKKFCVWITLIKSSQAIITGHNPIVDVFKRPKMGLGRCVAYGRWFNCIVTILAILWSLHTYMQYTILRALYFPNVWSWMITEVVK